MDAQIYETRSTEKQTTRFPAISWGAIFGGLASGLAVYLLLALFGLAAGLSAINPQSTEPVGKVPMMAAIWTGISLILSAFAGGYVAARMSGYSRMADGLLHGLVAWGISTLVFAYVLTTSVGALVGGAFGIVGQGAKAVAGGAAATAGGVAGSSSAQNQLETLLKGSAGGGGTISKDSMAALQQRLSSGDRDGAINVMVNQMGFTEDRATQVVDKGNGALRIGTEHAAAGTGRGQLSCFRHVQGFLGSVCGSTPVYDPRVIGGALGSRATVKRRHPMAHR